MIAGAHWLEPLLPSPLSERLLAKAGEVLNLGHRIAQSSCASDLPEQMARARVINSHYSNLVEGIESELSRLHDPVFWEPGGPGLNPVDAHIRAQSHLENLAVFSPVGRHDFGDTFSPFLISTLHQCLFEAVEFSDRRMPSGHEVVPGQFRSLSQRQVKVGRHEAPCWSAVDAMLQRMHQAYGRQRDPRCQFIACLAFHHRLAYVHPFDDGNGRVGRLLLHLQLQRLGLASSLNPISKALYERREGYYAALSTADQPRRGDLDGRGQLTQAGLVGFIEFLLCAISDCLPGGKG
ncbi:Fic family protein [Pseudomonas amygdali]|uniref:Filamentation induced by cAMP protein Fic n=2 Tax=Pseudomonas amygdali pv. lachrymans TaxID=53707 RepID=A0ABR5KQW0_PSEAV|nr:Fic family protein [Pseudomonas amygdali]AXH59775.1 hypothetical protein PLA107_031625 [Pseudomonas amygdali pv. lachrymans str. M301315]KPC17195.1 Filamentation induced by cAMP protein Fic [Pseudomonas amygdali pv. lachrymans]KPC18154.1 Filamentation induced by cAMP protein Fic [Pseudomonas amygdali pv. lachrymans]RMT06056.1 hypothetical protein ALP54_102859 [Pseudomonas amygdali pv. lachrymans]